MLVLPYDIDFFEHRKGNPVIFLTELSDFFVGSRFLTTKVIGGEAKHYDFITMLPVKCFPLCLLFGITTLGCRTATGYSLTFRTPQLDGFTPGQWDHFGFVSRPLGGIVRRNCVLV